MKYELIGIFLALVGNVFVIAGIGGQIVKMIDVKFQGHFMMLLDRLNTQRHQLEEMRQEVRTIKENKVIVKSKPKATIK